MTKGCYTIGDNPSEPRRKDTSYRSFICVLLIFLVICLIILFASINWGTGRKENVVENGSGGKKSPYSREGLTEEIENNTRKPNGTHEKIIIYEETTRKEYVKEATTARPKNKEEERATEGPDKYNETSTSKTNEGRISNETSEVKTHDEMTTTIRIFEKKENTTAKNEEESSESTLTTENPITNKSNVVVKPEITTAKHEEGTTVNDETTEESTVTVKKETITVFEKEVEGTTEGLRSTAIDTLKEEFGTTTEDNLNRTTQIYTTENTTLAEKVVATTISSANEEQENLQDRNATSTTQSSTTENTTLAEKIEATTSSSSTEEEENLQDRNATSTTQRSTTENTTLVEKIIATVTSSSEQESSSESSENTTSEKVSALTLTTSTATPNTSSSTTTQTPSTQLSSTTTSEISILESEPATEPTRKDTSPSLTKTVNPVCGSAICKTVSSRMLSMMNHSVEPCDDFYEFACGNAYGSEEEFANYRDTKLLEDELLTINESQSSKFLTDFKRFYSTCLHHEDFFNYSQRMLQVEDIVNDVGKFYFAGSAASIDLTDLVSSLILRQSMPLFDIGVDVDKHSSNFILQLNIPHQGFLRTDLEDWSGLKLLKQRCLRHQQSLLREPQIDLSYVYKLYQNCQGDYSSYLNSIEAVIRELKVFSSLSPGDLFKEIKDIRFTIEYEVLSNLDTLPSSADLLSDFSQKNYEIRRVADLQVHFPVFNWAKLFETVTGHPIQDNALVQVYFSSYFKKVFKELLSVDPRKLNNAFLAIYSYDLFLNTVLPKEPKNRNVFCTNLSKKLLPDIWSFFVFVKTPLDQQKSDNKKITDLFERLKKAFCDSFQEADWIDNNTRIPIVKKCNNLTLALFRGLDYLSLETKYKNLNLTENYQSDLITLLMNFKKMVLSTEGTYISDTTIFSYFLDPLSTKPLTFYASPIIAVPLGLTRRAPAGLPDYLVQTRVGYVLSRQLARHFDATGIQYRIRLTSTPKSSYSEFVHTMTTLMDYSSPRMLLDKNISYDLNGSLSNNERIVDNTAFRLIFSSSKFSADEDLLPWISSQYSREKVFFIAIAQEFCQKTSIEKFMLQVFEHRHLPAALRVENIVGNSEQFSSTFSCPDGSPMVLPSQLQFPFITRYEDDYQEEDVLQENK